MRRLADGGAEPSELPPECLIAQIAVRYPSFVDSENPRNPDNGKLVIQYDRDLVERMNRIEDSKARTVNLALLALHETNYFMLQDLGQLTSVNARRLTRQLLSKDLQRQLEEVKTNPLRQYELISGLFLSTGMRGYPQLMESAAGPDSPERVSSSRVNELRSAYQSIGREALRSHQEVVREVTAGRSELTTEDFNNEERMRRYSHLMAERFLRRTDRATSAEARQTEAFVYVSLMPRVGPREATARMPICEGFFQSPFSQVRHLPVWDSPRSPEVMFLQGEQGLRQSELSAVCNRVLTYGRRYDLQFNPQPIITKCSDNREKRADEMRRYDWLTTENPYEQAIFRDAAGYCERVVSAPRQ